MGNLIESLTNNQITIAVARFCRLRGMEPVNVRARPTLFATAIREYYQHLQYSDRRPLGRPLDVETLIDLADKAWI